VSEPLPPRERVVTLDVLRGFALLGVLLGNLYYLYSLRVTAKGPETDLSLADHAAQWFMRVGVQSRAQTLLCLLFGFGFAMQLLRAEQRGERFAPIYLRRVAALFVIGWLHVLLLAWVDVVWGYAIAAMFMLPFVRASNLTRVIVAAALVLGATVLYANPAVRPTLHFLMFDHPPPYYVAQFGEAARAGDHLSVMYHHVVMALLWSFGGNWAWYFPWLVGRFLIGYVAGAKRWFERDNPEVFRRMFLIGFAGAVPNIVIMVSGFHPWKAGFGVSALVAVAHEVGVFFQTVMYIGIVGLLMQRRTWRVLFGVLVPIGRMPLTTYWMQSLICTHLFYGFGLGWRTPSPAATVALGFAIFAVQIVIAHVWLRFFVYGPLEWLWRTVVYWRRQPMRA
jgi:uncharacterized protein